MKEYTDIMDYIEKEILTYSNSQLILEIARADFHSSIGALEPRDAVSAIKNNCDFIGFELLQEYVDMANNRINDIRL